MKDERRTAEPDTGLPESDEALFARFLEGDSSAFDALALRYKDRAFWVAYQMIRDADEALDLAQEAFARALVAARSFDLKQKFSTWFFRILVNLCIDLLRKRRTRRAVSAADAPEAVSPGRGPREEAHARDLRDKVGAVLERLPAPQRALLVMRDFQGLSCIEIAGILRCTHATARWRLHRARIRFREFWEERYGPWE